MATPRPSTPDPARSDPDGTTPDEVDVDEERPTGADDEPVPPTDPDAPGRSLVEDGGDAVEPNEPA